MNNAACTLVMPMVRDTTATSKLPLLLAYILSSLEIYKAFTVAIVYHLSCVF